MFLFNLSTNSACCLFCTVDRSSGLMYLCDVSILRKLGHLLAEEAIAAGVLVMYCSSLNQGNLRSVIGRLSKTPSSGIVHLEQLTLDTAKFAMASISLGFETCILKMECDYNLLNTQLINKSID